MEEKLNILFLKDVVNLLDGENLKYIVVMKDENYVVNELPLTYKGHISTLYNYLCYDYDSLSYLNKIIYQNQYKSIKKIDKDIYSIQTKTYTKINNYLPKQKRLNNSSTNSSS